jgi:hypothetical protein
MEMSDPIQAFLMAGSRSGKVSGPDPQGRLAVIRDMI